MSPPRPRLSVGAKAVLEELTDILREAVRTSRPLVDINPSYTMQAGDLTNQAAFVEIIALAAWEVDYG